MQITFDQLNDFFEDTDEDIIEAFVNPLNEAFEEFEINTPNRVAMFLAQVGHESGGLRHRKENLNYSAAGLNKIFPKYFKRAGRDANEYHRQPEAIANVVYANRMGNGDEASGEGWKFCGRGLIQLTGKNNYSAFAEFMEMDLDEVVEYLETEEGAAMSAGWFWDSRDLNKWADEGNIIKCTRLINGGTIGLADRKKHYEEALHIFGEA
jgi:putative chitinase